MNLKKTVITALSICIWLLIWFIVAYFIDSPIFLPTPVSVIGAFIALAKTKSFYMSILFSLSGILRGFLYGLLLGIILGIIAFRFKFMEIFLGIPIRVIKAVPVASFVILSLLWIESSKLSLLIAALMTLPIVYTSLLAGLKNTDSRMLEFAKVFRLSNVKKIRFIYLPAAVAPLTSAVSIAVGFAWKSGVAAEIIGLIRSSIGNELYKAKLYLETPQLFAWTITIIILSFICEKILVFLISFICRLIGGGLDASNTNN